ncbi:MAG: ABC transporter ATP-binding protein, partial [Planctomycetaceae bacterium]
ENGAGKTTSLKILLGLTEPDWGEARVFGLDSRRHGIEIRRRVGYVPEIPVLYDWMTVEETGWFAAGFYPANYLKRYRDLIYRFELPLDRRVKDLSKGMRAKVGLALAMAHEPELLVLDEPTSGLDPLVRREFLESMSEVAASGRTVILSSHQIVEVERVADVIAIIRDGKLLLVEKLDELKQNVCELVVTLRNGSTRPPDLPADVIRRERKERQWRMLVRGINESQIEDVRHREDVSQIDIRHPSLDDIFVAYMHSSESTNGEATGELATSEPAKGATAP